MRLKPTAIHINANIGLPRLASILNCVAERKVLRKITNMAVAMALAPPVNSCSNAIVSDGFGETLSQMRGGPTILAGVPYPYSRMQAAENCAQNPGGILGDDLLN